MGAPRLAGKVAVITGATSGLGLASAVRFGEEGARVVCVGHDEPAVDRAAREVRDSGADVLAVVADVTDAAAQEAMAAAALERFGQVDILFANAGIPGEGAAHETSLESWDRVIAVNLTGVFHSIRSLLPHFMERRAGAIVATASVSSVAGVPHQAAYAAAKGGVTALVRQIAIEYAGHGIRANAICPATVVTPLVVRAYEQRGVDVQEGLARRARDIPLGRLGEAVDVANLALFLASDEARWITGGVHLIDGGITAAMVPGYRPPD